MAIKFNAGHPRHIAHFDLLPLSASGCDLIQDIAHAADVEESALWAATRSSTRLRLASLPDRLILLLNVWPSRDVAKRVAAVLGLPGPAAGQDWAMRLPQVVVALSRTGFTLHYF